MQDVYCSMPWVGLNILPGEIRPCCHWDGAPVPLDKIRKDMLDGKMLDGCSQCYFAEQIGSLSKRIESIEKYGITTEVSTKVLEINFDNLCNLKCRGCTSFSSHLWHNDEKEIYGKAFAPDKYLESEFDVDYTNLTQIDISGGEPFLSKNVERFLDKLVKDDIIGNIDLGVVTNGTTLPSDTVFNALSKSKRLFLTISVDGIGPINDYFRSGANFKIIEENFKHFSNLCDKDRTISINTTVSIYNVTHLIEIEDYFTKNYPHFKIQHRMLQWPEPMAIQNMPDDLKQVVRTVVERFGPAYSDVLKAIDIPRKDLYGHFLNFHNALDKVRNETLPNKLLADYIANNPVKVDSIAFFKQQIRG
jgi:organic radical activating enzyme